MKHSNGGGFRVFSDSDFFIFSIFENKKILTVIDNEFEDATPHHFLLSDPLVKSGKRKLRKLHKIVHGWDTNSPIEVSINTMEVVLSNRKYIFSIEIPPTMEYFVRDHLDINKLVEFYEFDGWIDDDDLF